MSQMIDLNIQFYTDPETGLPIANGLVYVGVAGSDPTLLANQIPIFLRQEDGTEIATAQPVTLSGGAIPEYQGSPAQIMTAATDYATAVHDHNDAQVYYVSTVLISESAQNAAKTAADVVLTNADVVLTNADVVSTGEDVVAAGISADEAAASAVATNGINETGLSSGVLKVKVVDIGNWDMTSATGTAFIDVAHGLADQMKIRSITAIIQNDTGTVASSLADLPPAATAGLSTTPQGAIAGVTATTVNLQRLDGGSFDNAAFTTPPASNRGWVTIWYLP